jgi:exopolysaccharide biosynthesis polyprenyl glycosylphosphotransferase
VRVRKRAQIFFFVLAIMLDGISVLLSFSLAYLLRFHSGLIPVWRGVTPFPGYFYGSIFVAAVWMFVFYMHKLYHSESGYSFVDEVWELFKSCVMGSFIVVAPTFFLRDFAYSRLTFVIACALSFGFIVFGRACLRGLRKLANAEGLGIKKVAIVGGGEMGQAIKERIERNPMIGYRLIGQIIERNERIEGLRELGNIDNIREIAERHELDTLIMTFPLHRHHRVLKVLQGCQNLDIEYRFVPDLYEMMISAASYQELEGIPLIGLKEFPLQGWNRAIKRMEDIVGSLILLTIFSPVIVVCAVLVKLTSTGPIFFKQERIGEDGRTFNILKFRSMRTSAEHKPDSVSLENACTAWEEFLNDSREGDTRRTRVGKVMRKLSLDEIPQLFNVLKGEMSLVGPRPERPHFVNQFKDEVPRYLERHKVKSGITGWAQVNGLRGNTSIPDRIKHDLYYIENWSLGLDLKIMMRTVLEMFRSKAAH